MREPTRSLLPLLVWHVFHDLYDVRFTPSALLSGQDQLSQIESQIERCAFGVICLDGLRPNVIHEWGYLRGVGKPAIVVLRAQATVDVLNLLGPNPPIGLANPPLDLDDHLSNLKSVNWATWYPDDPVMSIGVIWKEYNKLIESQRGVSWVQVREPRLW